MLIRENNGQIDVLSSRSVTLPDGRRVDNVTSEAAKELLTDAGWVEVTSTETPDYDPDIEILVIDSYREAKGGVELIYRAEPLPSAEPTVTDRLAVLEKAIDLDAAVESERITATEAKIIDPAFRAAPSIDPDGGKIGRG